MKRSGKQKYGPAAVVGFVAFIAIMGFYLSVGIDRLQTQNYSTGASAMSSKTKGIYVLDPNDTALVQCLGLTVVMRDGKLTNNLWTGTQITCKTPIANPLPTVIPTPTPVYPGGYYMYSRYYPGGQLIEFTCSPLPGKLPIRVVLPGWGNTAVLLKCK